MLAIRDLGRQIQGKWIWQQLNLDIQPGERWAIAGASGVGKSLLLRAIAVLDPVQAGTIAYQGKNIDDWDIPRYRSQVMYLHQRPALLEGTVASNLEAIAKMSVHRSLSGLRREQILEYLAILGRSIDFLDRPTHALSGGEAQIVALVRALMCDPSILLFDEPTASLDAQTQSQFESLVTSWYRADSRRAYLWVSHDPAQLDRLTDKQFPL